MDPEMPGATPGLMARGRRVRVPWDPRGASSSAAEQRSDETVGRGFDPHGAHDSFYVFPHNNIYV
jgi:hypothetical protein